MKIPLCDLARQYENIKKEIDPAIKRVLKSGRYIKGEELERFERDFARATGARYAVGVNSGSDALLLPIHLLLPVKSGGAIITVPNSWVSTVDAIARAGGRPIFIDVDPETLLMNVDSLKRLIDNYNPDWPPVNGILPVHLFGHPVDVENILKFASQFGLEATFDCAQSHGAKIGSTPLGYFGFANSYSFYPSKVLGAYGDGGMITTNSPYLYRVLLAAREYGQYSRDVHSFIGCNSRLDAMQAAILSVKLSHMEDWISKRRRLAERYNQLLPKEITKPVEKSWGRHVYYVYAIRTIHRDKLVHFLTGKGIEVGIHFPTPTHLQESYKMLGYKEGDFPVAEQASRELLSLPVFPELTFEEQNYVVDSIKEYFEYYT